MLIERVITLKIGVTDGLYLFLARNGATFGKFGEEGREVITNIQYVRGDPGEKALRDEYIALRKVLARKYDELELIYMGNTFNWLEQFRPQEYAWQQLANRIAEISAKEMDEPISPEEEMELRDKIVRSNQLAREIGFEWAVVEEWWEKK